MRLLIVIGITVLLLSCKDNFNAQNYVTNLSTSYSAQKLPVYSDLIAGISPHTPDDALTDLQEQLATPSATKRIGLLVGDLGLDCDARVFALAARIANQQAGISLPLYQLTLDEIKDAATLQRVLESLGKGIYYFSYLPTFVDPQALTLLLQNIQAYALIAVDPTRDAAFITKLESQNAEFRISMTPFKAEDLQGYMQRLGFNLEDDAELKLVKAGRALFLGNFLRSSSRLFEDFSNIQPAQSSDDTLSPATLSSLYRVVARISGKPQDAVKVIFENALDEMDLQTIESILVLDPRFFIDYFPGKLLPALAKESVEESEDELAPIMTILQTLVDRMTTLEGAIPVGNQQVIDDLTDIITAQIDNLRLEQGALFASKADDNDSLVLQQTLQALQLAVGGIDAQLGVLNAKVDTNNAALVKNLQALQNSLDAQSKVIDQIAAAQLDLKASLSALSLDMQQRFTDFEARLRQMLEANIKPEIIAVLTTMHREFLQSQVELQGQNDARFRALQDEHQRLLDQYAALLEAVTDLNTATLTSIRTQLGDSITQLEAKFTAIDPSAQIAANYATLLAEIKRLEELVGQGQTNVVVLSPPPATGALKVNDNFELCAGIVVGWVEYTSRPTPTWNVKDDQMLCNYIFAALFAKLNAKPSTAQMKSAFGITNKLLDLEFFTRQFYRPPLTITSGNIGIRWGQLMDRVRPPALSTSL